MRRALPWFRNRAEPGIGEEIIRGEKVVIRGKRIEDAPDDYAWRTDAELAKLDASQPLRMSYRDFLKFSKDELRYSGGTSRRLAIDTFDGEHIGNCMYYDVDLRRGHAELGIMIGKREYWGRGYGTDTVVTLLAHVFTTMSINLVYLHTLEWNERARRAFAKSGLRETENVRRSGLDFVKMEIGRKEWEAMRPPRSREPSWGE